MSQMSFDDVPAGDALYVIGEGDGCGVVKIGRAIDPVHRLSGIQTGNPRPLRLLHVEPGAGLLEPLIHRHLKRRRLRGEWFDLGAGSDPVSEVRQILGILLRGSVPRPAPAPVRVPPRPDQMAEVVDARIAANFRAARRKSGLTQQRIVELMQEQGYTTIYQQTIARLEKGQQSLMVDDTSVALAAILGTTLPELLTAPAA